MQFTVSASTCELTTQLHMKKLLLKYEKAIAQYEKAIALFPFWAYTRAIALHYCGTVALV